MAERGELPLPEEETERAMYEETIEVLAKYGFHRYEISNYARDGYECRHNVGYWIRRDYLGFGIGAASLIDNVRFQNEKSLGAYLAHPLESREEEQTLTVQDRMEETMFLGLRLTRGVSCVDFAEQYGRTVEEVYGEVIARNVADGLLTVTERKENQKKDRFLALTKRGLDLSNYVMAQFLF
jgi:oxygen-independent coproporphyrinogen-3 oxidase